MKLHRPIGYLAIILALSLFFLQCNKGTDNTSGDLSLLKMLPENASGFVTINFKRIAELGLFKTMQESMKNDNSDKASEAMDTFRQFISQTGFVLEKDLQNGALAVFGDLGENKTQFVFLVQSTFELEKLITYAKSQNPDVKEETINGITYYHLKKTEQEETALCFPKPGLIAMGQIESLKKTIDIITNKGRSLMDNPALNHYAKKMHADALAGAAFIIPEKARSMQEKLTPPFEFDLSKAEAVTINLFFKSDVWSGELALISPNPEGNKKNANTLNMLKNMGVMLGPEVGEVLNGLTINANDKQVGINFSITKSQLEKLGKKAKESLPGMSAETSSEPSME